MRRVESQYVELNGYKSGDYSVMPPFGIYSAGFSAGEFPLSELPFRGGSASKPLSALNLTRFGERESLGGGKPARSLMPQAALRNRGDQYQFLP